jgi:nicotinic acid mononucleotide adenylyltransferase
MRIGLLGGSFDPAHEGHLYVSRIALRALKLDYVWWLVSPGNPLKHEPAPVAVRMKRARLMTRTNASSSRTWKAVSKRVSPSTPSPRCSGGFPGPALSG